MIPARHADMNPIATNWKATGAPRNNPWFADMMNPAVSSPTKNASLTVRVLSQNPTKMQAYMIPQIRISGAPSEVYAFGSCTVMFGSAKWDDVISRKAFPYVGTGNGVTCGIATVCSLPQPVVSQAL